MRSKQDSLSSRTVRGVLWSGFGQFGSQGIHYLVVLCLAWLLMPSDFGLVGLAMVFILFAQAVGELGLSPAIIHQADPSDRYLSTAFWANLLISLLMMMGTILAAGPIARFLGNVEVDPILKALSPVFPLTALAVIPRAVLYKKLDFGRSAFQKLISEISFGVVGLGLALAGFGVWSLVGAALAQRAVSTVVLWWMVPWFPRFQVDVSCLRALLAYGLPAMAAAMLHRGILNIDYFVVGKWLGAEALGYYTLAFQLAVVPGDRLLGVLRNVAFPSFVLVRDQDSRRLIKGFKEAIQHLLAVLAPLTVGLMVIAPRFIEWIYGEKWLPVVLPLQILALAGFFYGLDLAQALYFAAGKPQWRVWLTLSRLALFVVLASFLLTFGTVGVAIAMTVAVSVTALVGFLAIPLFLETSMRALLRPLRLPLLAGGLAGLLVLAAHLLPLDSVHPVLAMAVLASLVLLATAAVLGPAYLGLLGRVRRAFH